MGLVEKRLFSNKTDLQAYLTSLGFTIANSKMTWDNDTNASTNHCYWTVANDGKMNFHTSSGDDAFYHDLVDFDNDQICGVEFIELNGGGCALYMTPLPADFPITDFNLTCANNYDSEYQELDPPQPLQNGLVVVTPAEEDGRWRYSWRDKDPSAFAWTIDDTLNYTRRGQEIPMKKVIQAAECTTLTKVFLQNGHWSQHIFAYVLGEPIIPGSIYKINGQKYISFTDNTTQRQPAFRLPAEAPSVNPQGATDEYSDFTLYAVGDYCIYGGKLYRCVNPITTPKLFSSYDWVVTTVDYEKQSN